MNQFGILTIYSVRVEAVWIGQNRRNKVRKTKGVQYLSKKEHTLRMKKKKRISNLTAIFLALGAVTALQLIVFLEITDPVPMVITSIICLAIGYGFAYLIAQVREGYNSED